MEDRDFKSMMDEREAGKARGPPASSHFAKMQNATIWGVKPNIMGEGKDWVMPKDIPKAKENTEHIEKDDTIKDAKPAETTSSAKTTGPSPLEGVGNLTTKKSGSNEVPSFRDMMIQKAQKKDKSEYSDAFDDMMGHPVEELDRITPKVTTKEDSESDDSKE